MPWVLSDTPRKMAEPNDDSWRCPAGFQGCNNFTHCDDATCDEEECSIIVCEECLRQNVYEVVKFYTDQYGGEGPHMVIQGRSQ